MERRIKVKFSNGVIKPLEKLDIEEGRKIIITIKETLSEITKTIGSLRNSFGGWKGLVDAEELKRNIYEDRLITTRLGKIIRSPFSFYQWGGVQSLLPHQHPPLFPGFVLINQ